MRVFQRIRRKLLQASISGNPDDIINLVAFAPGQHLPTTKTRVPTKHNADLGPALPKSLHQQCENRPGMFGAIDLAWTQITHQQLIFAENIQWQIAVVIVVTMEETAFLVTVNPVIGGIEVQNQLLRCAFERSDKLIHHDPMNGHGRIPVSAVFPTT